MDLVFKALNDGTRRRILKLLQEKDMNAGKIAAHFDISKPSISHHLDVLKRANLISPYRSGQHLFYSINMTVVEDLLSWFIDLTTKDENHE